MEAPEATDGDLLRSYRRGSEDAFHVLYRRHRDRLFLYARSLTRDDAAAEDLVHETFLRLVRSGESRAALGPYLYTVLRRLSIDRARSDGALRRRERAVARDWIEAADPGPDPAGVEALNFALPQLPPEQLEVVVLHVYGGLTFQEVAEAVDVPAKTVMSRYEYALARLAILLGGRP